jgi:hypothetical protein
VKHVIHDAKVLVASDNADHARQIQRQLKANFAHVQLSTNPDRSLEARGSASGCIARSRSSTRISV